MSFECCPSCGSKEKLSVKDASPFVCGSCSFTFYANVATATAAIIENKNKILFLIRKREPKKGMLDLPGGFVDPSESAEMALIRELKEELLVSLKKEDLSYFGSYPNIYEYKKIKYNTCDLVFVIKECNISGSFNQDEIKELVWLDISKIDNEKMAFYSLKQAIEHYLIKKTDQNIRKI